MIKYIFCSWSVLSCWWCLWQYKILSTPLIYHQPSPIYSSINFVVISDSSTWLRWSLLRFSRSFFKDSESYVSLYSIVLLFRILFKLMSNVEIWTFDMADLLDYFITKIIIVYVLIIIFMAINYLMTFLSLNWLSIFRVFDLSWKNCYGIGKNTRQAGTWRNSFNHVIIHMI